VLFDEFESIPPPFNRTNILFVAEEGVIVAIKVEATTEVLLVVILEDMVAVTTCNTDPVGNLADAIVPVNCVATMLLLVRVSVVARPISVSVAVGKVSVGVPATAGAVIVTEPLVSPEITTEAILISYPMFFSQYNPS